MRPETKACWVFSVILWLAGLGNLSSSVLYSLVLIVAGLFLNPFTRSKILSMFHLGKAKRGEKTTVTVKVSSYNDSPAAYYPVEQRSISRIQPDSSLDLSNWYISLSFGKSTSKNYLKAVTLAKAAPQYHEQMDDGSILHQAIYSALPKEYLAFVMLYELVGTWKSSFVFINSQPVDRKIIGQLNYCYGDRCRSADPSFCYGASYMTRNCFGCHRIQISAYNHPLWMFYNRQGNRFVLDRAAVLQRINEAAATYSFCPCFDYDKIIAAYNQLPSVINNRQREALIAEAHGSASYHIGL